MQPVIYRRRRNAITRGEREWRVEDDALVAVASTGAEKRFAWSDIKAVRLCAQPARFRRWRYVFELQPRRGGKVVIDNASYLSVGRYEERSDMYGPFVRAAIDKLSVTKPDMRVLIGETPKRYFFLLLASLVVLCAAAYVLVAVRTPIDGLPYAMLIKLALVLLMLPVLWRILGAMPRGVAITDIPERVLPPSA
ncbi:MAG TPA: hypothetical protein VEF55_11775 [Candidatus Binatia bacterium]|nr:hypothetical protein [Candidatus Binatia bacterium]